MRASRLRMALRVRAGRPRRSMSMEVAVGGMGVVEVAVGMACASGEKRRDMAMSAEAPTVMNGRVNDAMGLNSSIRDSLSLSPMGSCAAERNEGTVTILLEKASRSDVDDAAVGVVGFE